MIEISENPVLEPRRKKPEWLRVKLPIGENYKHVRGLVDTYKLHTICESGNCPNMGECWGAGTATFMILEMCARAPAVFVPCSPGCRQNWIGMNHSA